MHEKMTLCSLIHFSLFVPFLPIYAQISFSKEMAQVQKETTILSKISEMDVQMHATPLTHQPQSHLKNVYGILILLGWGILLPIGAIIARYFRKFPVVSGVWYKCHVVCQNLGYILGTIGWCMWIAKSSKHFVSKTQSNLNIIAFTFINVQMLATLMRPNKEGGYCKCWNICHRVLGYAIIGIVIADIFVGLHNQSQSETLKWVYLGILGALAVAVLPLEIFRWKTMIMQKALCLIGSMFTNN